MQYVMNKGTFKNCKQSTYCYVNCIIICRILSSCDKIRTNPNLRTLPVGEYLYTVKLVGFA